LNLRRNFIERSLVSALSFIKESIFAEEYASRCGFLQARDARLKTISVLLFLLSALLTREIVVLSLLYSLCLGLVILSRVPLGFFLKRTWIFIPLFSLFIALPALFQFFSPGEPLWWMISKPGLLSAVLLVLRVVTCVSFVILLGLTTRHTELLRVLRIFGIPQIFVMTIGMCYRYIYLFIEIIENTFRAMESRAGRYVSAKKGQEMVTWSMASLWQRSYQLNNEIYLAMLSRGFRGEPKVLDEFKTSAADWFWLTGVLLLCLMLFLS